MQLAWPELGGRLAGPWMVERASFPPGERRLWEGAPCSHRLAACPHLPRARAWGGARRGGYGVSRTPPAIPTPPRGDPWGRSWGAVRALPPPPRRLPEVLPEEPGGWGVGVWGRVGGGGGVGCGVGVGWAAGQSRRLAAREQQGCGHMPEWGGGWTGGGGSQGGGRWVCLAGGPE